LNPDLTVEETLYYNCKLRLPNSTSEKQINEKVAKVIDKMGLSNTKNTIVGSSLKKGISCGEYKSDVKYHNWIKKIKKTMAPNKDKYQKESLYYDLQCNPQDYLLCMIKMMKEVEKDKVMIYNVFPMRNDIIMKSIKLDTTTLVHLLFTQKQGNKTDYLLEGNLKKYENKIWEFFFRTERQCFKKPKYTFHHMIETDGVSCFILMLRNNLIGKKIPNIKIGSNTEQYIDELSDYTNIKNKKIIAIDPKKQIFYTVLMMIIKMQINLDTLKAVEEKNAKLKSMLK